MTANQLFTDIMGRGQQFLSEKQTSWLRSMVIREFPDSYCLSDTQLLTWDGPNGETRSLRVRRNTSTGMIHELSNPAKNIEVKMSEEYARLYVA